MSDIGTEKLKQIAKQIHNVICQIGNEVLKREDRKLPDDIFSELCAKIDSYVNDIQIELIKRDNDEEAILTIYNGIVIKVNKDGVFRDAADINKHDGEIIYL